MASKRTISTTIVILITLLLWAISGPSTNQLGEPTSQQWLTLPHVPAWFARLILPGAILLPFAAWLAITRSIEARGKTALQTLLNRVFGGKTDKDLLQPLEAVSAYEKYVQSTGEDARILIEGVVDVREKNAEKARPWLVTTVRHSEEYVYAHSCASALETVCLPLDVSADSIRHGKTPRALGKFLKQCEKDEIRKRLVGAGDAPFSLEGLDKDYLANLFIGSRIAESLRPLPPPPVPVQAVPQVAEDSKAGFFQRFNRQPAASEREGDA